MGSVGDCYDNALCESFFATLECELLDRRRFRAQAEARLAVFQFIEGWIHLSLVEQVTWKEHDTEKAHLFLIVVGRAPASLWDVVTNADGRIRKIHRKDRQPWVNHYAFHIWDEEWGT